MELGACNWELSKATIANDSAQPLATSTQLPGCCMC